MQLGHRRGRVMQAIKSHVIRWDRDTQAISLKDGDRSSLFLFISNLCLGGSYQKVWQATSATTTTTTAVSLTN